MNTWDLLTGLDNISFRSPEALENEGFSQGPQVMPDANTHAHLRRLRRTGVEAYLIPSGTAFQLYIHSDRPQTEDLSKPHLENLTNIYNTEGANIALLFDWRATKERNPLLAGILHHAYDALQHIHLLANNLAAKYASKAQTPQSETAQTNVQVHQGALGC
ncbi:MAG: hypothetical protein ACE5FT_05975 [Candidatus Nanoarchaeia archaeon]